MPTPNLHWLHNDASAFPPTSQALGTDSDAPGLLAAGGRINVAHLEQAYRHGIFPWYSDGQPVLWWAPDPRMVLPVAEFKLSRSLRKTVSRFARTPGCELRIDSAFDRVIAACAGTLRDGQRGTWIMPVLQQAYVAWHRAGAVHSVETWVDGRLVGGLYGVGIGRMFFGESMFSHATRCLQDRPGRPGGVLPRPRHHADRLPAEHRAPGVAGRTRDFARRLRTASVPRPGGPGARALDL